MPITRAPHPKIDDIALVSVLAAMGDPIRLSIVRTLSAIGGEQAWSKFDLPIAQSTLSHHLKVLRTAGVIQNRQEGTRCFVSLRKKELNQRFPGLLASVLRASR